MTALLASGQQLEQLLAVISQQLPALQPAAIEFIAKLRSTLQSSLVAQSGSSPSSGGSMQGMMPPGMASF